MSETPQTDKVTATWLHATHHHTAFVEAQENARTLERELNATTEVATGLAKDNDRLKAEVDQLNARITTITTDVNYEGGVQAWIQKHDAMAQDAAKAIILATMLKAKLAEARAELKEAMRYCDYGSDHKGDLLGCMVSRDTEERWSKALQE